MKRLAKDHAKEILPSASQHEINLVGEMIVVRYKEQDDRPFTFHSYKGWSCTLKWTFKEEEDYYEITVN